MIAYLAAWLFVFAVPWQNAVMVPGLGTISKAIGFVAIAVTGIAVLFRGDVRRLERFHVAVMLFVGWVGVSTFWAYNVPSHAMQRTITYFQLAAMLWVIWEAASTRGRLLGLLQAYILGGYVAAVDTIANYQSGREAENLRYAAAGFDPNDLGSLLALGVPIAWYLQATAPRAFTRWIARFYLPLAIVAIGLTGSRGAMLATVVGLLLIPWTVSRLRWGARVVAVLVVATAVVFAVRYVPESSWARLSTTQTELAAGTLNNRLVIWKAGLRIFPQRPLHGFGPAGFPPAVIPVLGQSEAPHNTFLAVMVEEGLIGLILYLAIFGTLLRAIWQVRGLERRFALVLFATLFVSLLPLGWETAKPAWLIWAFLLGVADRFRSPPHPAPVLSPTPAVAYHRL